MRTFFMLVALAMFAVPVVSSAADDRMDFCPRNKDEPRNGYAVNADGTLSLIVHHGPPITSGGATREAVVMWSAMLADAFRDGHSVLVSYDGEYHIRDMVPYTTRCKK
jgi:hypothetical protein